jgi:hypothetical protein
MNNQLYQKYLHEYVNQAVKQSNGSISEINELLSQITVGGFLTRHKAEKKRALQDAMRVFSEHRHWPLEIILSHLGVEIQE